MRTVTAIRHIHFEDLGSLEDLLKSRNYEINYIDATTDDLSNVDVSTPDLMVFLGGPIGAFDEIPYPFMSAELALVKKRLENKKPILGICLGAQLIARALGAKVYPMGPKEIGFGQLTLTPEGEKSPLAAIGETPVLHWHGDQFDIPVNAERLASTSIGSNQAFSVGPNVLGLQFHLEADVRQIERWLVGHACELSQAGIDPRNLRTRANEVETKLISASNIVFGNWLDKISHSA